MAARKGGLALLLGSPSSDDEGDAEGGADEAKKDAAQALVDAVKGGDADEVALAFQDMYDLCAGAGEDDYDDTEEEL